MHELEKWLNIKDGTINDFLLSLGYKIAIATIVLVVGFWLAKQLSRGFNRVLKRRNTDESLVSFLTSLTSSGLKVLVVVTAMTQLGVEMTSFVALLGAAGLAIGLAFSGTLSNFAGGVMLLLFKPFKVGDFIETQEETGVVKEIQIFNTILNTSDNKVIILANGAVANNTIINFTKADKRRVDWVFGIGYGDDLKLAKSLIFKFINEDDRILKDEENFVSIGALRESSVDIVVKAWVDVDNYWPVFYQMNERVYNEFGSAGLSVPFPHMDVHFTSDKTEKSDKSSKTVKK